MHHVFFFHNKDSQQIWRKLNPYKKNQGEMALIDIKNTCNIPPITQAREAPYAGFSIYQLVRSS